MDDISLVKSEPMADGTAYDEETVGMNSSSDTEDDDSCVAIINEDNLIELTLEQTSKLSSRSDVQYGLKDIDTMTVKYTVMELLLRYIWISLVVLGKFTIVLKRKQKGVRMVV